MTTIALMGAGGKMGFRLSTNLQGSEFQVRHVPHPCCNCRLISRAPMKFLASSRAARG